MEHNKLQRQVTTFGCDPGELCPPAGTAYTDHPSSRLRAGIGNFVYQNGELEMARHPQGIIRPTPPSAENTTEFVYDYFIKDYPSSCLRTGLGNVLVVLTEENATYNTVMMATSAGASHQ